MRILVTATMILLGLLAAAGVFFYVLAPGTAYQLVIAAERQAAGLEARQIQVDGITIRYLEGGRGETVLLLHGFGADKDSWTRLAAELTDDYRVIAPDLPGFGESDRPPEADYGITAQAARVHAFARALDLDATYVGGNSMGGAVAGAYAAAHPDAVRSLWLLAPFGVADAPPSELRRRIADGGDNLLLPADNATYYQLLDWVFEHQPYIPAPVQYVLAERAVARRTLRADILAGLDASQFDLAATLADTDVPTLIVWGRQDRLLHPDGAAILAEAVPNARLQMLDDTGHAPMIEWPARVAEQVTGFAADQRPRGTGQAAE